MANQLTLESAINLKMSPHDVVRHFKPEATDEECSFLLWEKTCFPFCMETTITQLRELLQD